MNDALVINAICNIFFLEYTSSECQPIHRIMPQKTCIQRPKNNGDGIQHMSEITFLKKSC